MDSGPYQTRFMNILYRLTVSLATLVLISCQSSIPTHHEYDSSAPFRSYKTFAWVDERAMIRSLEVATVQLGPFIDREIRDAVERNLLEKGYKRLESPESVDLVVSFSFGTRERIQVDSYPSTYGYRYRRTGPWVSDVRTYTEGTLAIDFFDRGTKEAVWHGWARKRLQTTRDEDKRRERINAAVDAILKPFPFRNTQNDRGD